ncbi:MAG: hypothetical protein IJ904_04555 [Candidatus Methanomethylophilaceae archaeon]|nr:hypothetical protein [Candidatus Methanomethylophilaceae archaeon]
MRVIVISIGSLDAYCEKHGIRSASDLTDKQFDEICRDYEDGWSFDSLEEFVDAFNEDRNDCPVPTEHCIRIIRDVPSPGEIIRGGIASLKTLRTSGYIPFASPAPSSTEVAVKRALNRAVEQLEFAESLHESLYHDRNRR